MGVWISASKKKQPDQLGHLKAHHPKKCLTFSTSPERSTCMCFIIRKQSDKNDEPQHVYAHLDNNNNNKS